MKLLPNIAKQRFYIMLLLFFITVVPIRSQWTLQNYDTNYTLRNINFISDSTGFAAGLEHDYTNNIYKGIIYKTVNRGSSWNIVFLDSNFFIYTICFQNNDTGFCGGGLFSDQPKIVKTTDGGNNWFYINPARINSTIYSLISFGDTVYATCFTGVFKSFNGCNSWNRILTSFSYYPSSYFINENSGWSIFDDGFIFKTTNGGSSWDTTILNYRFNHELQFIDANTGFLICDSSEFVYKSKILKTTDGGSSWNELTTGLSNHFWSLNFVNENTGYIAGTFGGIIKTTNGGETWGVSWTGLPFELYNIRFLDPYLGYACGGNGIIINTTSGGFIGISPVSNDVPDNFSLFQNYPNPFNPSTNIKFAVSKGSNVNISVYDILGREVETLLNKYVPPGTYEVQWNAVGFSSGIYFYKITTDEFASVKKMSLIK